MLKVQMSNIFEVSFTYNVFNDASNRRNKQHQIHIVVVCYNTSLEP